MKLFELQAVWNETYDCPDNGEVDICENHETIAYAVDDSKLKEIIKELALGYKGRDWSLKRCNELRKLYSGYDDWRETEYKIVDISDMILE